MSEKQNGAALTGTCVTTGSVSVGCGRCNFQITNPMGCLKANGQGRFFEVEKMKKGLTGDCEDFKPNVQAHFRCA